jgi:hypothetical protein
MVIRNLRLTDQNIKTLRRRLRWSKFYEVGVHKFQKSEDSFSINWNAYKFEKSIAFQTIKIKNGRRLPIMISLDEFEKGCIINFYNIMGSTNSLDSELIKEIIRETTLEIREYVNKKPQLVISV